MQDVTKGKVLGERYELTTELENNASFARWIARDEKLNRNVLVTIFSSDSPYVEQALDSARRSAGLEDPRIVRVLDAGKDDDFAYVVEEAHLGAHHLADLVRFELPHPEEARRIVGETATALEAARHRGLHHLALNPTHVLRLADGSIAITHIAVEASIDGKDDISSSEASRADAQALVELLYLALTGLWPGKSLDVKGLKDAPRRADRQLRAPSQIVEGVPNDLDTLTRQTLNHGDSPASPGAVARQLSPWSSQMITAPGHERRDSGDDTDPNLGAKVEDDKGFTVRRGGAGSRAGSVGAVGAAAITSAGKPSSGKSKPRPSEDDTQVVATSPNKGEKPPRTALPGKPGKGAVAPAAAVAAASTTRDGHRDVDPDETGSYTPLDEDSVYERTSYDPSFEELEPPVPGLTGATDDPDRSASRLALALVGIFVVAALVLAILGIKGLGQPSNKQEPAAPAASASTSASKKPSTSSSSSSSSTSQAATPVGIAGASVVNKFGYRVADTNANEAVDGDENTGWTSLHYLNQSWGGFQSYGGLAVKLDESAKLKQIKITPDDQLPLNADIYVGDTPGTSGQKVGSVSNATTQQTVDAKGAKGNYVTIFITNQPMAPGESYYQSGIKEVSVEK